MSEIFAANSDGYGTVDLPAWLQNPDENSDGAGMQIRETVSKGSMDDLPERRKKKGERRDGDRRSPRRERVLNATAFDPLGDTISARRDADTWTTGDKPARKRVKGFRLGGTPPTENLGDLPQELPRGEAPSSDDPASRKTLEIEEYEVQAIALDSTALDIENDASVNVDDGVASDTESYWLQDPDARAESISATSGPGEATVTQRLDKDFNVVEESLSFPDKGSISSSDAEYDALKKDLEGILSEARGGNHSSKVAESSQAHIPGRRSYSTMSTAQVGLHQTRTWPSSRRYMSVRPREKTNGAGELLSKAYAGSHLLRC